MTRDKTTQRVYHVSLNLNAFSILELDPFNFKIIPTHVSCLVELNLKHKLFYLAHKLVDEFPSEAISWFAVGSYYAMIQKHAESRRYFRYKTKT